MVASGEATAAVIGLEKNYLCGPAGVRERQIRSRRLRLLSSAHAFDGPDVSLYITCDSSVLHERTLFHSARRRERVLSGAFGENQSWKIPEEKSARRGTQLANGSAGNRKTREKEKKDNFTGNKKLTKWDLISNLADLFPVICRKILE